MNEQIINVADAKKKFSELLGKVAYGREQVLITKRGKPMARLIPVDLPERHLSDVQGWLDENDSFFHNINTIIQNRKKHIPRVANRDQEK